MKQFKNFATSLTALSFLVIAISGVMLFFHLSESYVKELHEILGLAFVVAVLLHVYVNWTLMKRYFTNKIFLSLSVLMIAISAIFVTQNADKGGVNPKMYIIKSVINKPMIDVFTLFDIKKDVGLEILKTKGYKIDTSKSIMKNAKANKVSPFEIVLQIAK